MLWFAVTYQPRHNTFTHAEATINILFLIVYKCFHSYTIKAVQAKLHNHFGYVFTCTINYCTSSYINLAIHILMKSSGSKKNCSTTKVEFFFPPTPLYMFFIVYKCFDFLMFFSGFSICKNILSIGHI